MREGIRMGWNQAWRILGAVWLATTVMALWSGVDRGPLVTVNSLALLGLAVCAVRWLTVRLRARSRSR